MKKSLLKNNGVQSLIASLLCIVLGMLIGVPLFAVIYSIVGDWIRARLQKKHLPSQTESYLDFAETDVSEDSSYLD